jgi:nucleotide-binding universal stress UspA family protein
VTSHSAPFPAAEPTLLVGHGRDPSSDHALAVAVDLARRLGARLHVAHAICLDDYPIDPDAADWEEQGAAGVAEQRRHVEQLLADTPVRWSYEARRGEPGVVLARAAAKQDALMIVVGTRGEGWRPTRPPRPPGAQRPRCPPGWPPRSPGTGLRAGRSSRS